MFFFVFCFFPKYCKVVIDSPADTQWDGSSLVFWSVSRPSAPGQSSLGGAVCKQRKPQLVHIAQAGTHTQPGRPSVVCGPVFFFFFPFFHFFFSLCLLLSPLSLSACPAWGKTICFKTRAKYYHIYIFLFQAGG